MSVPKAVIWAAALLAALSPVVGAAQDVVADGATATSVTLSPDGRITVGIAPSDAGGVSRNSFSALSSPAPGLSFDNRTAAAATILSEVTGVSVTRIEGVVDVLGPQADLIIANPNGVVVDGGRFIGVSNLALTTGALRLDPTAGTVAAVASGTVEIGPGGLSGAMRELALVSAALRIDGAVAFDVPDDGAHLNAIVGRGETRFDATAAPGDLLPWARIVAQGIAHDGIVVDVSGPGAVSTGRISITVTDAGAGVRIAGDQSAGAGAVRLRSSGRLEVAGAAIVAGGSVDLRSAEMVLVSGPNGRAELVSESSGVVLETLSGDMTLGAARISGRSTASDALASLGGVTLISDGALVGGGGGSGLEIFSAESSIAFQADEALALTGATLEAFDDIRATTGAGASFTDVTADAGDVFSLFSTDAASFAGTQVRAGRQVSLAAAALTFGARQATDESRRTEIIAEGGAFSARSASGDIVNYGALLQGAVRNLGNPLSLGALTLSSAGDVLNRSVSADRLAVLYGELGDLSISAAGDLRNETGRLFSNRSVSLSLGGDFVNLTDGAGGAEDIGVTRDEGGRLASSLWLKHARTVTAEADFGTLRIEGELARVYAVDDVTIEAHSIFNLGGDVTGGALSLTALAYLTNASRLTGAFSYRLSCGWFCKSSGTSTLAAMGGTMVAARETRLAAGDAVRNEGGRIVGGLGLAIDAPMVESTAQFMPTLVQGPANFFGGRRVWLSTAPIFGGFIAAGGDLTVTGDYQGSLDSLGAAGEVIVSGASWAGEASAAAQAIGREPFGMIWGLF